MSSLKKRSLAGVAWTFAQQFSVQGITFFVSIILARLLMPEEFGLIGMITVVIAIGQSLRDSGMTQSLIRTVNPTEADYSTVFFMNLLLSVLIYLVIFFTAPAVALFYEKEVLVGIIRVLALKIPIGALSSIQNTRLTKELMFKQQMIIQIPSLILASILGVYLAYSGYGVWSLVYMNLSQVLLSSVQLWIYSKWRPKLLFDKTKVKEHFSFGYKLTLASLINVLFQNIYVIVIGKFHSAAMLGFYTRAQSFKDLPVKNIVNSIGKVSFPLFSKVQNDERLLKSTYKKLITLVLFVITPTMIFLGVYAKPIFILLLTEKWLPAVPYFQILCIVGITYPLHSYNLDILKVKGRSGLFLKLELYKKIVTVAIMTVSIPLGIYAIIWGQVINNIISFFINSQYSGKLIGYPTYEQIIDASKVILVGLFVGLICFYFDSLFFSDYVDWIRVTSGFLIGVISYFATHYLLKTEVYYVFIDVMITLFKLKKVKAV